MQNELAFVFVHGLSGWGRYDPAYQRMPYWGMCSGDLMEYLRGEGFPCFAASVAPTGSAWDRACELYAQLAGTVTDYGKAHSERCGHERFGRDFTGDPLIPSWDDSVRLVLLGHSFGGATVRLLSALLAEGDAEERNETDPEDLSPLFRGGMADRIHSIVTLAAPTNGTTAYDLFTDPSFDADAVPVPWWSRPMARLMSRGTAPKTDTRIPEDYAGYDMHIDNAMALNERIPTLPDTYYFAVPCSYTKEGSDGSQVPKRGMEPCFVMRSCQIGAYTGKTAGGIELGKEWMENDGLVNTVSSGAPSGAPWRHLGTQILPGIWNVFPAYDGDHMALQGGLARKHDIRPFYLDLLTLIRDLPAPGEE